MTPKRLTTVELLHAVARELEHMAFLSEQEELRSSVAKQWRAGAAELHARAERLSQALAGRGGPVLAAMRRLNAAAEAAKEPT